MKASFHVHIYIKEVAEIRKLKKYTPTNFKSTDSFYDKFSADYAVAFIQALSHTKGTWSGKPFELIDWLFAQRVYFEKPRLLPNLFMDY